MWSRRNRDLVAAAAVIATLLAVGSLLTTGLVWREQRRTASALEQSNAVVDFLINDLLGSAAPKQIRNTPVTVEEVLANAEEKFRCLKTIDLHVRPIYLRDQDHVRAHLFLCMLAYHVEWHLRRAWGELLYADEQLQNDRWTRDPVVPPQSSPSTKQKKRLTRMAGECWYKPLPACLPISPPSAVTPAISEKTPPPAGTSA